MIDYTHSTISPSVRCSRLRKAIHAELPLRHVDGITLLQLVGALC